MAHLLSGKGVHTGSFSEIQITSRSENKLKINLGEFNDALKVGFQNPHFLEANYCTVIKDATSGKSFSTAEHFLACLYTWSRSPANISCFGNEIPGMDGSAQILFQKLSDSLGELQIKPNPPVFVSSSLNKSYPIAGGNFSVRPHSHFRIRYQVINSSLRQEYVFEWREGEMAENFYRNISPARTFILWKNFSKAMESGLLKGAEIASGVLLAENPLEYKEARKILDLENIDADFPTINCRGFRLKNECARHKILDFLGDLAWCGLVLPRLDIQITNGGHFHHLKFVKDLIYERISAKGI